MRGRESRKFIESKLEEVAKAYLIGKGLNEEQIVKVMRKLEKYIKNTAYDVFRGITSQDVAVDVVKYAAHVEADKVIKEYEEEAESDEYMNVKKALTSIYISALQAAGADEGTISKMLKDREYDIDFLARDVANKTINFEEAKRRFELIVRGDVAFIRKGEEEPIAIIGKEEEKFEVRVPKKKRRRGVLPGRREREELESFYKKKQMGAISWTSTILHVFRPKDVERAAKMAGVDPYAMFTRDIPDVVKKLYEMGAKPKDFGPATDAALKWIEENVGIKKSRWL